jgi:hypothetical protein
MCTFLPSPRLQFFDEVGVRLPRYVLVRILSIPSHSTASARLVKVLSIISIIDHPLVLFQASLQVR